MACHTSSLLSQVHGRDEYFLGNHKMGAYKYIRDSLASGYARADLSDIQARLVMERRDGLYKKIPESKADEMLLSQRAPKLEE